MIRVLTFSSLFPSSVRPGHGIFVETRLRELVKSEKVHAKVVAPVPWFPSTHPRYGSYARMARTPLRESRFGLDVSHPRYLLPPRVGMTVAPFVLAAGSVGAIRRLVAEGFDFDLIDAHYYYPDGVAAALLAKYFRVPFAVTARGSDINLIAADSAIPRRLMRWASNRAEASIGVSQALVQAMAQIGMDAEKLHLMPNGVDLDRFTAVPQAQARATLGWSDQPTLLSVGNLVENKGHHLAIEMLEYMPEFRLVVAGEGPQREELERSAQARGLSGRVVFLGRVEQDQLAPCYAAADMLVLASSREGWPNVVLESMACGTPVIATAVGGVPEIITTRQVGRLVATRTAPALAQAAQDLWQHMPSPEAVRSRAVQCGWQRTTDAQLALFRRLAAAHRSEAMHA